MPIFPSPAPYDDATRIALIDAFAALTLDAMALESAVYLAHRACRGPLTPALHPLLGAFAAKLGKYTDSLPEYVATLGGQPTGTAEQVADRHRLGAFPPGLSDGAALLRALHPMVRAFLLQCHGVAATANEQGATEALDLVTRVIAGTQFYGWQIAAAMTPADDDNEPPSVPSQHSAARKES